MHTCLFFFFFIFHKILNFWKLYPKRSTYVSQAPFVNLTLKKTIAFYFKHIGKPNISGQKEKDKNKTEWWVVRHTFLVQRTDTSHTKQVWRASSTRFLSWLSFNCSSGAVECVQTKTNSRVRTQKRIMGGFWI